MRDNRLPYGWISAGMIASAVLLPGWTVISAVPVVMALLYLVDRGGLRSPGGWKFWIWMFAGGIFLPFFGGGNNVNILGFQYSVDTLLVSLRISSRGYIIFSAMILIRRHTPPNKIAGIFWKIGLKRLSYLIPLSFHIAPALLESIVTTYNIWRMRGGWKRMRVKNILLLLTSIQLQMVREAEDLAAALALKGDGEGKNQIR